MVPMQQFEQKILIVEDSNFNAQVLAKAVSALAPVSFAVCGTEALDMMAQEYFDVILLDIVLPDIDGFEVCRRVMGNKDQSAPAIIFVTSLDGAEDEERGLSIGAVDYLYKPIVASLVRARVSNHLQLSHARRELVALNIELNRLATIDFLTNINNRRHFYELMEKELARAGRYQQDHALIALDLDHFKSINDTYGHDRGDAVLKAVADAWSGTLRINDILGRVGGEEFSIFLPQTNKQQAEVSAERLLEVTRKLEIPDGSGGSIGVTASIGIALPLKECAQPLSICADKALYEAKNAGRDRAVCCSWSEECRNSK